jgi:hypothetical protein
MLLTETDFFLYVWHINHEIIAYCSAGNADKLVFQNTNHEKHITSVSTICQYETRSVDKWTP